MDLLPLIPEATGNQNVSSTLRKSFQDTLNGQLYPKDKADNIVRCNVESDIRFKQNACKVVEIHKKLSHKLREVQDAALSIMCQQGSYLINIDTIENIYDLKERTKLKHCKLFRDLKERDVEHFGFLQKYDLLPDIFKQYLDYRLNENLHLCEKCLQGKESEVEVVKRKSKRSIKKVSSRIYETRQSKVNKLGPFDDKEHLFITDSSTSLVHRQDSPEYKHATFKVEPEKVQFHNCDIGRTYRKTIKLINTSRYMQSIIIGRLPKTSCLSVYLDLNSRIAPGMAVNAKIVYKPNILRNIEDLVSFRNNVAEFVFVTITVTREPPMLISCIFQPNSGLFGKTTPGSNSFVEKRRIALNATIDCGTCLIGEYVFLSMFMENAGKRGKFFIITEDEWYNQNVENISVSMELANEYFWIYPTFFELNKEDLMDINIIFHPFESGLHIQKYYIMCDNNSFEQFEILGDASRFQKSMIKIDVPPNDNEIETKENYCIFFGNLEPYNSVTLTLSVHNTSSLILDCYWNLQHKPYNKFIFNINESWINILNTNKTLAPYSTTDFDFEITLNTTVSGYYSIFLSFFILDVPIISLVEDQEFIVFEKNAISPRKLTKCVDVRITELEVSCFVRLPKTPEISTKGSCGCVEKPPPKLNKLEFCSPFMEFGILASGLSIKKSTEIRRLSQDPVVWEIVEVKYNIDDQPHMEILEKPNISCKAGVLSCPCKIEEIWYTPKKEPMSWVSVLLLMSKNEEDYLVIESTCVVTYEVIDYNIWINTGNTEAPILCPLELLYTGIPTTLNFSIENHSLIAGCFYLLNPFGDDLDKVEITVEPRCSILNPFESKEVTAKITCKHIGIIENLFLPCFVGAGQESIIIRLLLAVDGVHVIFYLPEDKKDFQKVLWPPTVLYEFDEDWMFCPCSLEESPEFVGDSYHSKRNTSESSTMLSIIPNMESEIKSEIENIPSIKTGDDHSNQIAIHEGTESTEAEMQMSSKTTTSTPTLSSSDINLRRILEDEFGDELYLQKYVVEVHRIPVKTARKFSFYFENSSPIATSYSVEATNFYTDKKFDETPFKLKQKKITEIWSDMILNEFGIVVQPEVDCGDIPVVGLIEINLWIYANTWGIYMEEIVVDIPDVISFTFSLLIEIIGGPIMIPLALNTITEYPTIRFGKVAYRSPRIVRKIKIDNNCSAPVNILWHTFLKTSDDPETNNKFNSVLDMMDKLYYPNERRLIITRRYYGRETTALFEITPSETIINANSSYIVDIVMKPENFPVKKYSMDVRCSIIGHIYVEEKYRKKLNYFFRDIDEDFVGVQLELLATLELPILTLDFICGETKMFIYANDVIFNKESVKHVRLLFQNNNSTTANVEILIDEPFKILRVENGARSKRCCSVKPQGCLEVLITISVDHTKILELSQHMYSLNTISTSASDVNNMANATVAHTIDTENKMMRIQKHFKIHQHGVSKLTFPMDLYIYFPNISVKPTSIKFDNVLVGKSAKTLVSVFNLTGCLVKFEIYKSLASDELFVTPHYGEIPKSTGVNKQFVDIFIYFTPRDCKMYQESIRVVTNIPNYYIEIPVKGAGSINEKYQVDYKI